MMFPSTGLVIGVRRLGSFHRDRTSDARKYFYDNQHKLMGLVAVSHTILTSNTSSDNISVFIEAIVSELMYI